MVLSKIRPQGMLFLILTIHIQSLNEAESIFKLSDDEISVRIYMYFVSIQGRNLLYSQDARKKTYKGTYKYLLGRIYLLRMDFSFQKVLYWALERENFF